MPIPLDPASLHWHRHVPADDGGPVDPGFIPFTVAEIERPAIERLDAVVARNADRIAVDDGTVRLTFADVQRIGNDLAAAVAEVCPPDRPIVGIVAANAAMVAFAAAALTSNRVNTIIDAAAPADRRALILEATRPGAILLGPGVALAADEATGTPRIVIDPELRGGRPRPVPGANGGSIGFTSGSTGMAKGIFLLPDALNSIAATLINGAHLGPDDTILSIAPASSAGRDVISGLLSGARIRMLDIRSVGLAAAFRTLANERVTTLSFVPTALRSLLAAPGAAEAFQALRLVETYGESLLASDLRLFRKVLPAGCRIDVIMASTEALMITSWSVADENVDGPVVPVGRPVDGKEIALVGEDGHSVPDGEVGEVVVRSRYTSAGVWRDGAFHESPVVSGPDANGARICATGDYARLRPDGLYEFAGRLDQQVKIRGLRADLGVVEAGLRGFPGVADAVTLLLSPEIRLAAFVTVRPGVAGERMPAAVREGLAATMPAHMVPAQVMVLDVIPRLPNLKPDRVKLMALARGEGT